MKAAPSCTKCSIPLPLEYLNSGQFHSCLNCSSSLRVELFPAYFREETRGSAGEALVIDTEASCFYHAQKKAAVICSSCGRFLCALCDFELDNAHFCAACLESAKQKGKLSQVENSRRLYDTLALQLAVLGCIPVLFYFVFITAPAAIFIAIKHWNTPSSIVRGPSKWRQITAIILASLQLIGIAILIGIIVTKAF